tara:strand:+ start:151 stop:330 length:180 start_codon:yes stop_codon:yes gene_type:complete
MIKDKYTINEILIAVDDLQKMRNKEIDIIDLKSKEVIEKKSEIPMNTLKLIEEAEDQFN